MIYRKKLFGHFFISSQAINGATAPATKKYIRAKDWSVANQFSARKVVYS